MSVQIGLDRLLASDASLLTGRTVGLILNHASVTHHFRHALDELLPYHRRGDFRIGAVFGPEHGLYGHTQDNMIEWEGQPDQRTGLIVHSLYGQERKPTAAMLEGLDTLVFDIPDIGSRYYTFVWTMALAMEAAAEHGLRFVVLDRPNPINGVTVEGPVLEPEFRSFVGWHAVPTRHARTAGEIAEWVRDHYLPGLDLTVVRCEGWDRSQYGDETGAPWVAPSPNMPTVDTAVVYPGGCLLEATNLSEGRGTTRPFETVGAPFLDGWKLADALNGLGLGGVYFRPVQFEPTFNKYAQQVCEGVFLHVTDRRAFRPVLATVAIMQECIRQTGLQDPSSLPTETVFQAASAECTLPGFAWKRGPYEYEFDRRPIDLLAGNRWLEPMISELRPLGEIRDRMEAESMGWSSTAARSGED